MKMNEKIAEHIAKAHLVPFTVNGHAYRGKHLESLHLIVQVKINVFESGFFNGDICTVMYEGEDGRLVIKRFKDGYIDMIDKKQLSFPTWGAYPF